MSAPEGLTVLEASSWDKVGLGTMSPDEAVGSVGRDGVAFMPGSGLFLTLLSVLALDQNPPSGSSHSSTRPSLQELRRKIRSGNR